MSNSKNYKGFTPLQVRDQRSLLVCKHTRLVTGFTLIEVIIYIALFTILVTSGFVMAFELIEGNNKTNIQITLHEESNFVMRKLDWALTSLDPSISPTVSGSGCSQTLTLYKLDYPSNPIIVRRNSNILEMSQAGGSFVPITTVNVTSTCLKARIIPQVGTIPFGVTATTTINGQDFSITKYIRK